MDALRSAPALSGSVRGSAPAQSIDISIKGSLQDAVATHLGDSAQYIFLGPVVAESPTSFREDLTHCTSRRKNRSRHISISPNVLPVELCELWARSYEPEKRAEGNSERIIQVVIVRTIFGA